MRLLVSRAALLVALGLSSLPDPVAAFVAPNSRQCHHAFLSPTLMPPTSSSSSSSTTALFAKKKKGGKTNAKDAALAALDAMEAAADAPPPASGAVAVADEPQEGGGKKKGAAAAAAFDMFDENEPLSKKDQMALEKKQQKEAKKQQADADRAASYETENREKAKRKKALAALAEMEAMEKGSGTVNGDEGEDEGEKAPPMSKKEAKLAARAAAKKEEKMAAKNAKKGAKQADEGEGDEDPVNGDAASAINGEAESPAGAQSETAAPAKITMEERLRKERPPPRIRIMDSAQPDYTALRLEKIAVTFRDQPVLTDATWTVQTGDRIGLVGANGAGKTTQLRVLAGELEPTAGDVIKSSKGVRVSMLRQEFVDEIIPTRSLRDEFKSVFVEEAVILEDLRSAEKELEGMTGGGDADADAMQAVLDRMADLQAKADVKDVNSIDSKVSKIMDLMGFQKEEGDYEVSMFSGGWKMRIGLGKVLLKDPNVLLLDEPTNHLDLESVEWLEEFLRQQNIPMVIVSHDREFLDQVCTKIVDAEGGVCSEYTGNYSKFLGLKKARLDAWNASYNAQEKKIKEERQWISKFKIKQPQAVKQRIAKLEKMKKSDDYVQKPPFLGKPFRFRFPDAPRLSPEVAEVKGLCHGYGDGANPLFEDSEVFIQKGDRIAVIGPNGAGKSTLLRILMGKEEPDAGSAEFLGANVFPSYFEQNQADVLDLSKTVVQTVQGASEGQSYNELRALLGQFLFKGDAVEKKVENLSGGEKARLSLCCMMMKKSNLLILDEPTNHLDIPAKEMLEEALQHFEGSVVVISHDRFFISKVATTIIAIEDKKLVKYQGDYKNYMDKSQKVREKIEARHVMGVERIGRAPIIDIAAEVVTKKKNFGGAKTAGLVTRKDKGVKNAKRNQSS